MTETLTPPERYTERAQAREYRKMVKEARGCLYCTHRAWTFAGQGFCRQQSLTFPRCLKAGQRYSFTPDYRALRRREAA